MVIVGEFWAGATGYGLAEGFRRLGWAVQEVDRGRYGVGAGRSLPLRVLARLFTKSFACAYRQKILDECRALHADVLLVVKGVDLSASLLDEVKAGGTRTAMYYPDYMFNYHGVYEDSFRGYDLFATTKTFQVPWLRQRLPGGWIEHVAHGYVDGVHAPAFASQGHVAYAHDVLYAGNHSAYKQRWLEDLLRLGPGLDLAVIGNRWREQRPQLAIPSAHIIGERIGVGYAQAIQAARINIALHLGPTNSEWQDLVSTRTFEIPACKGFMLHIDNDEVREYFQPGREIDVFSSPEELHDKIAFYLVRPELREKMIERAYARCVPAYGYASKSVRLQQLMGERGWLEAAGQQDGDVA
ncbi:MAG: glycosyltransferase [Pseudoxanthomonas sp.]